MRLSNLIVFRTLGKNASDQYLYAEVTVTARQFPRFWLTSDGIILARARVIWCNTE